MPRSLLSVPLAYSDFWELAGGGGEPARGRKRRKREERENVEGRWGSGRTNGGLAEGWKRRCDRGEWASPETEVDLSLECEDKERRNAGSATRFTALLGISGDRAAENGFHY